MNREQEKKAKNIQEFYLYPGRSMIENCIRGCVCLASWIVGIKIQPTDNLRMLGGAYFIFSISMLQEFLLVNRKNNIARIAQGIFCSIMILLLLGSLVLVLTDNAKEWLKILNGAGCIAAFMLIAGLLLSIFQADRYWDNGEKEIQQENEKLQQEKKAEMEAKRRQFSENLNGTPKGGDKL